MNKLKYIILCLVFFISFKHASSQDIHFSQFYFSPLYLNPAQTGLINGNYRVAANYRNQWSSFSPFKTFSGSFDMPLMRSPLRNNFVGVGGYLFNDDQAGIITSNAVLLSGSYVQNLGYQGSSLISVGVQGGVVQKRFNMDGLTWGKQISTEPGNEGLLEDLPSGESFSNTEMTYPDFGVGALYFNRPNQDFDIFGGFSLYHLLKPKESFSENNFKNLSRRMVLHAGSSMRYRDAIDVLPSVLYMKQGSQSQLNVGAALRFNSIIENSGLQAGLWYRTGDALIFMTGAQFQSFTVGFSYDFNVSPLPAFGSFEVTLIYLSQFSHPALKTSMPCPRF